MTYAIQVKNLCKKIGEHTILNEISMQVKNGEIYGFLGANGSGKTSLMKSVFQMMIPDSEEVLLWDTPITRENNGAFAQIGTYMLITWVQGMSALMKCCCCLIWQVQRASQLKIFH